jgi:uncharacterized protein YndB with AHSA1/START domain
MKKPGPLQITTPSEREIVITRVLNAPRKLVFDAWTKPELVRRWLLGPPGWSFLVCEIDLKVGGAYRFVWRMQNGTEMGMGGIYREIVPPERIVNTQLFDQDWTRGVTTTTNTVLYTSKEARDGALSTRMAEGMEAGYARLDELLASLQA